MSDQPAERPTPTVYENRGGEVWERHPDGRRELFAADIIERLVRLERERDEAKKSAVCIHEGTAASAYGWALMFSEAKQQRDQLAAQFTKLDKPKYSGAPMMDKVLSTRNPEFDAWVQALPPTYWTRYDLSAARIGWEAAKGGQP